MEEEGRRTAAAVVAERVHRFGPLRFDEVLEIALYDPDAGFYGRGGGAGRGGDFLTSPEVGPLFGAILARAVDEWWAAAGEPDPFVVVEAGAGSGALAAALLGAPPACAPALRYVAVERSPVWRQRLATRLQIEPAALVLGPPGRPGSGPLATVLEELPAGEFDGVVLANELLDNLPFRLLERREGGWWEIRVDDALAEVVVPAPADTAARATTFAPDADPGSRIPLQSRAGGWLRAALGCLRRGRVVLFDYADTTPNLAGRDWREWVRTYRGHGRGGHPLAHLGTQDVTCEVALDQLAHVRPPTTVRPQADFLAAHGIDEATDEARRAWQARAAVGDLEALRARSRVTEAAALTDRTGLGGFVAAEWAVGGGG